MPSATTSEALATCFTALTSSHGCFGKNELELSLQSEYAVTWSSQENMPEELRSTSEPSEDASSNQPRTNAHNLGDFRLAGPFAYRRLHRTPSGIPQPHPHCEAANGTCGFGNDIMALKTACATMF